jgi:hypothetical protein
VGAEVGLQLIDPLHPESDAVISRPSKISAVAITQGKELIAVAEVSGTVALYRPTAPTAPVQEIPGQHVPVSGYVVSMVFTKDGHLAAANTDGLIAVFLAVIGASGAVMLRAADFNRSVADTSDYRSVRTRMIR